MSVIQRLKQLKENEAISMHVPGHKNMTIGLLDAIDLAYDMTEIPGLDNLHNPEDIFLDLNRRLSMKYDGYTAQAVVNGSTTGMLAAIFTAREAVESFIIVGDAHKSVYHALDLLHAPYTHIVPDDILTIQSAKGVIITHPTYLGDAFQSLDTVIQTLHSHQAVVIVDEAHGAHNDIAEGFLTSAMHSGVDIVVQSYHKMLPALTGASVIYARSQKDMHIIRKYIDYFETSSPSYLIAASIELAEQFYQSFDASVFYDKRTRMIEVLREKGICVTECDDPAKILLHKEGIPGSRLDGIFRRHSIYSEMYTAETVLWCLPLFHQGDVFPFESLIGRIESLHLNHEAKTADRTLNLTALLGKTCIRTVVPYPPGIPIVVEGDIFHEEVLDKVKNYVDSSVKIEGIKDNINYYMDEDNT